MNEIVRRDPTPFAHWEMGLVRLDNKSRMSREAHARFCKGLGVRAPGLLGVLFVFTSINYTQTSRIVLASSEREKDYEYRIIDIVENVLDGSILNHLRIAI